MLEGIESALAELGVNMGDWPDMATEIAGLIGPEAPERAEDALRGVARKPRFVGAEAWLAEVKTAAEARASQERADVSLDIYPWNG
jgi:hypothetical protein